MRLDTTSLRGVFNQQIHGSKRSLRSVEDFTEFEDRTAYFNGDQTRAFKKGGMILDRVHVGGRPSALAATRRTVYVADRAGGKLIRLDSVTAKAEGKPATIKDPVAMRSGGGSIWVADRKPGTVTRVELF